MIRNPNVLSIEVLIMPSWTPLLGGSAFADGILAERRRRPYDSAAASRRSRSLLAIQARPARLSFMRPIFRDIHCPVSTSASMSTLVVYPAPVSAWFTSCVTSKRHDASFVMNMQRTSVATLPVAPGEYGQPPRPATSERKSGPGIDHNEIVHTGTVDNTYARLRR